MGRPVGWGILGCGDVADRKAGGAFNKIPGSRLVSVMRRDAGAAEAFARRHGALSWSTDSGDVIDNPDVDIVYVATPPANHLEYALAVAGAGKPCLVEKPAGRSLEEFARMQSAFRAAGLPLFVSYYRRHLPRFLKVKEILGSGALGEIVSIDYRMTNQARNKNWALDVATSGGGQFYGLACHILDLFDFWFGPLEHLGSDATNAIPGHVAEDAVSLAFRTDRGAVGSAIWNFAASQSGDELVIDGTHGRLYMRGTPTSRPIRIRFDPKAGIRISQDKVDRWLAKCKHTLGLPIGRTYRFPEVAQPHAAMLSEVTRRIAQGGVVDDNADAARRTATIIDRVLAPYYGGRDGDFWDRPSSWGSRQAHASLRSQGPLPEAYRLSESELETFESRGFIGPYTCEAHCRQVNVRIGTERDLHLGEADLFEVCTHPSIILRLAQVMGSSRFSLFKTRFAVKRPKSGFPVAWHRDIGAGNGGLTPEGKPVPTVTIWLSIDGSDLDNGGLQIIPGSHTRLIGSFTKQLEPGFVEENDLTDAEFARAVPVSLKPGQFIIFHSWLLHGSGPNRSRRRRAALNMRFAPPGVEREEEFTYIPIDCGDIDLNPKHARFGLLQKAPSELMGGSG